MSALLQMEKIDIETLRKAFATGKHFEALGARRRCGGGKGVRKRWALSETKAQLGGLLVLEARDLNHAIRLLSKHPGVKAGHLRDSSG
jgi:hypothetical protein